MEKATKDQKTLIRRNCQYKVDIKEEFVQWATDDNNKTSLNDLSFEQANKILKAQGVKPFKSTTENWGYFDMKNAKHKIVLSILHQAGWTLQNDKYGAVPDIERLSDFLKSKRCPVNKPLKKMKDEEVEKVIIALKGVVKSKYRK